MLGLSKAGALLAAVALLLVGCASIQMPSGSTPTADSGATQATTLNVFAAASLTDAFSQIGNDFADANPGTEVVFNFAGSNHLATQIVSGAPVDVFASANPVQMRVAIESGRIMSGTQRTFAHNRLVVIAPGDNPAELETLADLGRTGVKVVFAASEVPVGRYTLEFLEKAALDDALGETYRDSVMANIVSYEQNVRAVLAKVTLGEADVGVVYTSDVGAASEAIIQIEIPDSLNTVASYPIAHLADSAQPAVAEQFVDYVLSPAGQAVLAAYGFIPPTEADTMAE